MEDYEERLEHVTSDIHRLISNIDNIQNDNVDLAYELEQVYTEIERTK